MNSLIFIFSHVASGNQIILSKLRSFTSLEHTGLDKFVTIFGAKKFLRVQHRTLPGAIITEKTLPISYSLMTCNIRELQGVILPPT